MRYRETKEQSGEILRLALQFMGRHDAPFDPLSYAVWYEYAAGFNQPLRQALDKLLADQQVLDAATVAELHTRFIAGRDAQTTERFQAELRRVMEEVHGHAAKADASANHYGRSLTEHAARLEGHAAAQGFTQIIGSLLESTRQMQGSVVELQARLKSSGAEIEKLRSTLQRVEGEVLTDPLTGARNRRGLDRSVAEATDAAGGTLAGCSLLLADIDHFKRINDTYGHLFGDQAIRAVAQMLRANVKGQDTVARYGGEEFVVLLPNTPLDGARTVAENIRAAIEKCRIRRMDNQEYIGGMTISLGVAAAAPGEDIEALIRRADEALYESKNAGRNRVTVSAHGIDRQATGAAGRLAAA